ncbi:hypothetical protein PE067_11885 [Paracoccus sp. DMF-8]|uniref:hypothetical protein n=1 Tax=Paracoccus sp. DMF-8 TaxID=3019445 RepID=UPI0023E83444|nr:hypothetical protein [Paracoccus sp. DMF-8]MDF3606766.1 hypothetical protein [Paracoccus sp. DMF-8]
MTPFNRPVGLSLCALMALATPGLAQDETPRPAEQAAVASVATCGGETAAWIANAADGSDVSGAESPLQMSVGAHAQGGALIGFRVTGESEGVRIEAVSNDGDPSIVLLTADGDSIAENDDAGGTLNSRIETTLGPGDYCVRVQSFDGGGVAAQVQVGTQDQPRLFEDNVSASDRIGTCNASTEMVELMPGDLDQGLENGRVSLAVPGNRVSYLRFDLAKPTALTLRAESDRLDPTVVLFDFAGQRLAENDDADGTNSRLDFPAQLEAGSYCLAVTALTAGEQDIQVSAEKLDAESFLAGAYRRGEIVPPFDGDFPVTQLDLAKPAHTPVLLGGSAQWFTFQIDRNAVVVIEAYGSLSGADPKLALFGENGAVLAENDDYGDSRDSRLPPTRLAPGRYMIALTDVGASGFASGSARAVALVTESYLRAE